MNSKNPKTILLVEDEAIIAMTEKTSLEKRGYTVITADTGKEAIRSVDDISGIDLILMDINLGDGMDGTEATKIILANHNIPVVFLSSHTESEIVEKTETISSYGYVTKDSGISVLDASIKMAFKLFDANRKIVESENTYRMLYESANDARMKHPLSQEVFLMNALMKHVPEYIYFKDLESRFIRVSDAQARKFGVDDPSEILGKTDFDFFTEENARSKREDEQTVIRTGLPVSKEESELWIDKPAKRILTTKMPLYDAERNIIGTFGISRDITELKQIEEALRVKTMFLEAILHSSIDGVMVMDSKGSKILQNQRAINIWKIPSNIVNDGDDDAKIRHDINMTKDPKQFVSKILHLLNHPGEVCTDELELIDGTFLERYSSPVLGVDGQNYGRVWISRDITKRKLAEEALAKNRMKYLNIFENIQDVYYETSIDGTILEVSPSIAVFSKGQYQREDIIGKSMSNFYASPELRQNIIIALQEKGHVNDYEVTLKNRDGEIIISSLTSKIIQQEPGQPVKIIGTLHDITDRKRSEDKIKSLLAEKELLLREVHHRIKNNMSTLNSLLNLQAMRLKEPSAAKALKDAAHRILSMMVLYDRLYQAADFRAMSVHDFIPHLVDGIVANFPNSTSVKIVKTVDDFILDTNKLQPLGIIINELITNTMKYAFTDRHDGIITISVLLKGESVTLVIADNGKGIPDSIDFEKTTSFGLVLVRMMALQLNGTIKMLHDNGTKYILEFEK